MAIILPAEVASLCTAEEFLEYFSVPYDRHVVTVSRLHILQRFHEYLAAADGGDGAETDMAAIGALLARAYDDFVRSDPLTERVFKVLKDAKERPQTERHAFVPLSEVARTRLPENS